MEDDPYAHLFRTNHPPGQIEITSLQQGVESMLPRISQLRSELEFLEGKLRLYRLALSPTRRLPAEILTEIFTFLDDKTLLKTSMVCRAWYSASAALSAKTISTNRISFYLDVPYAQVGSWLSKPVKGIKTLKLEHDACDRPCGCYKSTVQCPWTAPKFIALWSEPSKFPDVDLGLNFSSPHCLLSLVGGIGLAPSWRSRSNLDLTFGGSWPGRSTKYRTLLNYLPDALKTLSLRFRELDRGRSIPPIEIPATPFDTLTTLALDCSWNSPFVLSVVRASPNLGDLSLSFWNCRHTWTETVAPVSLPKVHTLCLKYADADAVGQTIQLLRLPALEHLRLYNPGRAWCDPHGLRKALTSLRLLSSTQHIHRIRSLDLDRVRDDAQALWDIFSTFPFLENLTLKEVDFGASCFLTLDRQHLEGTARPLLPALRKLEMWVLDLHTFDLALFLLYVKARQAKAREGGDVGERSGGPVGLRQIILSYNYAATGAQVDAVRKENSTMLRTLSEDFGSEVHILVRRL
ncbi:hypothetical protein FA13DRAFT_1744246 [Coprinellus micaceus]|uniref:F-box domain-containing protein n=1 Tax=Coprinellus micaceus TaxID=71717 RepID=A0A4Y7SCT0_COPMI|nr:hypothetical protein FA13DRAFT_1744246 [Coprinellus micaceus]